MIILRRNDMTGINSSHQTGPDQRVSDLTSLVTALCPNHRSLLSHYCTASGRHNPSPQNLVEDLLTAESKDLSRIAALMLRELRFAGLRIEPTHEASFLRATLNIQRDLSYRESAAIALQGTADETAIKALIGATEIEATRNIAIMALRLTRHAQVGELRNKLQAGIRKGGSLLAMEAFFDPAASIAQLSALSDRLPESFRLPLAELFSHLPAQPHYISGLQRTLAAIPFRDNNEVEFNPEMTITQLAPMGYRVEKTVVETEDVKIPDGAPPLSGPLHGIIVVSNEYDVFLSATLVNETILILLVLNSYTKTMREAPEAHEGSGSDRDALEVLQASTLSLPLSDGLFTQRLGPLVAENTTANECRTILLTAQGIDVDSEDVTIGDVINGLRDPRVFRVGKLYAARIVHAVKYHPAIADLAIEEHLLRMLPDRSLTPYTRHAASIALQDSTNEATVTQLAALVTQDEVGDYAAVALRGAATPSLFDHYRALLSSKDPIVRMRAYSAAFFCKDSKVSDHIDSKFFTSKWLDSLCRTRAWNILSKLVPRIGSLWNLPAVDPLLCFNHREKLNPLGCLWVAAVTAHRDHEPAVVSRLRELPIATAPYDNYSEDTFILDIKMPVGTMHGLGISIGGVSRDRRLATFRLTEVEEAQMKFPTEYPLGIQIGAVASEWLVRKIANNAPKSK